MAEIGKLKILRNVEQKTGVSAGKVKNSNNGKNFARSIGNFFNDISGQTAQNEFNSSEALKAYERQRQLTEDQYELQTQGMIKAGLNPALLYGSGGSIASSAAQASASGNGVGIVAGTANMINAAANLMNANDNTRSKKTQQSVYNSAGKLIKTIISTMK